MPRPDAPRPEMSRVRLDEPSWWYGPGDAWQARLLMPAAKLWGHIAERRWAGAKPVDVGIPVICIGNFTAGGTGKTPLSLHIAATVQRMGRTPVFLTRGYGGRLKGPHRVDVEHDSAGDVGDEPLLLARLAPVTLARDRASGARAIAATGPATDVIIMDDGLQNPALRKDLTIAVVDGRRGIGNRRVIPAGPLRAPLAAQLPRVEAVVINHPAHAEVGAADAGAWFRQHFNGSVLDATTVPDGDLSWLDAKPVIAYCAIGAPQRFFGLLRSLGASVVREITFPDHHQFTEREAAEILAAARAAGAVLATTEKDWVRLDASRTEQRALKVQSRPIMIKMVFAQSEQQRLQRLIEAALVARTCGSSA